MSNPPRAPMSVLDEILCTALAIGVVLVALLPAARGMSTVGWLPMWLVGMPAAAWWAARGFAVPMPRHAGVAAVDASRARRRHMPQARRGVRPLHRGDARRAA